VVNTKIICYFKDLTSKLHKHRCTLVPILF